MERKLEEKEDNLIECNKIIEITSSQVSQKLLDIKSLESKLANQQAQFESELKMKEDALRESNNKIIEAKRNIESSFESKLSSAKAEREEFAREQMKIIESKDEQIAQQLTEIHEWSNRVNELSEKLSKLEGELLQIKNDKCEESTILHSKIKTLESLLATKIEDVMYTLFLTIALSLITKLF